MKFIGDRISHQDKNGVFSVVIAASTQRSKEALLAAWLLAWTLCGLYFMFQLFWSDLNRDAKLYIFIIVMFWAYYEYRIVNIFLWRKFGYESIKMKGDKLYVRNVIKNTGKPREFFLENIDGFVAMKVVNNWMKTMDSSFWVKGNDYIHFKHHGQNVSFGKQLNEDEASRLVSLLNKQLADRRRELRRS